MGSGIARHQYIQAYILIVGNNLYKVGDGDDPRHG